MFGVTGQNPFLRDAADRRFGAAHGFSAQGRGGAQFVGFALRVGCGDAWSRALLSAGEIVVMIVMMIVVGLGKDGPSRCDRLGIGLAFFVRRLRKTRGLRSKTASWRSIGF